MKIKKVFYGLIIIICLGAIGGAAGVAALVYHYSQNLPDHKEVANYKPSLVTTVYASDGSIMGNFSKERRYPIAVADMPEHLPKAFLAAEDGDFYKHNGVNPKAILRAAIVNFKSGTSRQGGSTITQQVIKRLLLTPEKSYARKIKEAILAYRLEQYLSKDEILTIYLTEIFLGHGAYGVEAAARTYFAKHVNELTIAESAVLASLAQAPGTKTPYLDWKSTRERQIYVLGRLLEEKWITQTQYLEAVNEPMNFKRMSEANTPYADWYLEAVRRELNEVFNEENAKRLGLDLEVHGEDAVKQLGFKVHTAMVPKQQEDAAKALRHGIEMLDRRQGWRGALENISLTTEGALASAVKRFTFTPDMLANDQWVKGIVISIDPKKQAIVQLGAYKGIIPIEDISWCRKPNVRVDGRYAGAIKSFETVLTVGDIVYVAARKGEKIPAYEAAATTPENPVLLSLKQIPAVEGALVSLEVGTGNVIALVGGYDYSKNNQFHRAIQSFRQPGSAFKPFVYSAALDAGYTPATIINDVPFVEDNYRPKNAGKYNGPTLFSVALARSLNTCTIRIVYDIGMEKVTQRAAELGIKGNLPNVLSIGLGAGEVTPMNMTEAYSVFANGGKLTPGRLITKITDLNDNILYEPPVETTQVISPQNAYVMASLLRGVVQYGTGGGARVLGPNVAGKTGTTNAERDAWFVGISPHLATSVYIGFDNPAPMGINEGGSRAALPIFVEYRQSADKSYPNTDFIKPDRIAFARIDAQTGLLAGPKTQKSFSLPFIAGTQPRTHQTGTARTQAENLLRNDF